MNSTSTHFNPSDDIKARQRQLVMSELRKGPRSTNDLRALGVMSPAARVLEARRSGLVIDTLREGRCAVYKLCEVAA